MTLNVDYSYRSCLLVATKLNDNSECTKGQAVFHRRLIMITEKPVAALFDFDGVVVDTETQYTCFWDALGKKYYPEEPDFGLQIKGQTMTQIFELYFKGNTEAQQEILALLDAFERQMTFDFIPGVTGFMAELRAHNVKIAIVTSSDKKKMAQVYAVHPELHDMVDHILTAEYFTRSKPAPDCYLQAAELFGTVSQNCVVFEDSFHGLASGNAAQMKVVGLSTTNPEEVISSKCHLVIPDFTDFTYEKMMNLLQ